MVATAETQATDSVPATIWIGFAMMCVGMFMAVLDVQVVATSLPTIQKALDIPQDQMSWIQTAYLIAEIVSIPLTGFLTRTFTMRWLFVVAISIFTFASIGCAASGSFQSLIGFRIVQGFSGGTLIPPTFSSPPPGHGDCDWRGLGRSCADAGTGRRRLDHIDLFLAVAVSHQSPTRTCCCLGSVVVAAER
jgi:hypothetical protein